MAKNNKGDWPEEGEGYLEISDKGFGFLRSPGNRFQSKPSDIFVTPDTIRRHYLREGCFIKVACAATQGPQPAVTRDLQRERNAVQGIHRVLPL